MCERTAAELWGIDLGDQRLNRRSERVLEALSANPEASINGACEGSSDTLAAYRIFDNNEIRHRRRHARVDSEAASRSDSAASR